MRLYCLTYEPNIRLIERVDPTYHKLKVPHYIIRAASDSPEIKNSCGDDETLTRADLSKNALRKQGVIVGEKLKYRNRKHGATMVLTFDLETFSGMVSTCVMS